MMKMPRAQIVRLRKSALWNIAKTVRRKYMKRTTCVAMAHGISFG